jgi:hypothetical protein
MVMAFFLSGALSGTMGGRLRVFWEGGSVGVELPHVRVAVQVPVCLCVCVDLLPPFPLLPSSNLR